MGYSFNGTTKVISLTPGTTTVSVRDLWSRWVDWMLTSDNSKFLPAFDTVGGNDIDLSGGTKIPIYAFLQNGWKIKPQESNHTLIVNDGVLLVNGGGDPFIDTTGSFIVRINYQQPVQAITVATGGSGLTAAGIWESILTDYDADPDSAAAIITSVQKILGLDAANPVTTTPTAITAGDIDIVVTGDGETTTTLTRQ
jgi:hypothetical protein